MFVLVWGLRLLGQCYSEKIRIPLLWDPSISLVKSWGKLKGITLKLCMHQFLLKRKFRPYLLNRAFVILTIEHHFPFVVKRMHLSTRISKWVLELQEFEYSFMVEVSPRASLADVLTYRHREKKITFERKQEKEEEPLTLLVDAFTLSFYDAYKKKTGLVGGGCFEERRSFTRGSFQQQGEVCSPRYGAGS